ncbi:MAG: phage/plasmid primase, P4 family [Bacteroidales bacterium]|nr:phage/plasmid primase, P4 family [Bacteroidales bacterium]
MEDRLLQEEENSKGAKIVSFYNEKTDLVPFIIGRLKEQNDNIKYFIDFYIYEEYHWQLKEEFYIKKYIQEFCEDINIDSKQYKYYKKVDDLFAQAKLDLYTEMEPKKNLLNFKNGTLELDTMQFREHRREDYLFYCLPYDYDMEAKCNKWEAFLDEVLPQKDLQLAFQEAVAYPLSNLHLEKMSFVIGSGSNGKSLALSVIAYVLGEKNVSHVTLEQIVKNDGKGIYQMLNKLINITFECSANILNTSAFKSYVSGEALTVRKLYNNEYTSTNYPQTIIASNSIPQSSDFSEGYYRRFNFIPFDVTIPKDKINPNLKEELCVEAPGIMQWIIEGIIRLRENKRFSKCETIEKMQNEYRIESDNVCSFLFENNYTQSNTKKMLFSSLYREFEDYCQEYNYKPLGKKNFKQRLAKLNYEIKYCTGNNLFIWIEKKNNNEETTKIIVEVPEKKENKENDSLFDMSMKCPF